MNRIPIRWRLALAFALAMAVVLTALGAFLYLRLEQSLVDGLDETLELRAAQITSSKSFTVTAGDEGIVQLYDPLGRLLSSSPRGEDPILVFAEVGRGLGRSFTVQRDGFRVLVTPVDKSTVLAVGTSLEDTEDALSSLLAQLLVVGPLALLLASVGGYFLAAAALRPVEAMRREAEAVSASEPGRRLTLSPANDELRRLGETLNTMLGRLEVALERERRFVADASHELRTPLAMLRTELELALRRERTPEELQQALRSASEETERLSQLAEDLLVLARAEGGELPVRREQLSARELLEGVRERFAGRATGRAIDVEAEGDVELVADRLRLEQAMGNLVENSIRHGHGRIVLSAARVDNRIELHVRDEGPGFPPELLDRALEPFSRGDVARTGQGAGLGLAIVDVIARAHGGTAHVANVDGGADAWIVLPGKS